MDRIGMSQKQRLSHLSLQRGERLCEGGEGGTLLCGRTGVLPHLFKRGCPKLSTYIIVAYRLELAFDIAYCDFPTVK